MATDAATSEVTLQEAEMSLQAAIRSGDTEALDLLLDDRAVYTGPDGSTMTKEQDLAAHRSRTLTVDVLDQQDLHVTVSGTTGVTRVLVHLQGTAGDQPFTAVLRYTRTWVRTDGTWRVLAAHASALPAAD